MVYRCELGHYILAEKEGDTGEGSVTEVRLGMKIVKAPMKTARSKAKAVVEPCSHAGARRETGPPPRPADKDSLEVVPKKGATNLVLKETSAVVKPTFHVGVEVCPPKSQNQLVGPVVHLVLGGRLRVMG